MMQSRRSFVKKSMAGAAALGMAGPVLAGEMLNPETKQPIHVFTKCLQFLSYEEMAELLAEHGFAGADMTVRPGGQVLPENVETDLPKAIKALRNAGIDSKMITTSINNPEDKFTRPILKTMADLGIRYYRTGYLELRSFQIDS
jgi:L-ribulose-5-phosphate 3-epimerase